MESDVSTLLWTARFTTADRSSRVRFLFPCATSADSRRAEDEDEPTGGAHQDHDEAARLLDATLWGTLTSLDGLSDAELVEDRYQRFRALGSFLA